MTLELTQKQEIVHRLKRENDDKGQALKLATAEIVDLRRAMKMLQGENQILRRKMGDQEAEELGVLVGKEIQFMNIEELKAKVTKLAQAYRSERVRNEEFSRTLKSANVDLGQAKTIAAEYDNLQIAFKEQSSKLASLAKENKKTSLYKDTVKKQEAVITRLETLLEKLMKERKQAEILKKNNYTESFEQHELDGKYAKNEEDRLRIRCSKLDQ